MTLPPDWSTPMNDKDQSGGNAIGVDQSEDIHLDPLIGLPQ